MHGDGKEDNDRVVVSGQLKLPQRVMATLFLSHKLVVSGVIKPLLFQKLVVGGEQGCH